MGKFIIYKRDSGYNFHLKAVNGETIGTSDRYAGKGACMDGIESVIRNSEAAGIEDQTAKSAGMLKDPKFMIYRDEAGKYCFRLTDRAGHRILESQAYTAKASCQNGIRSVKSNAPTAEVAEHEIKE